MTARKGRTKRQCVVHVANEPWTEDGAEKASEEAMRRVSRNGRLKNRVSATAVRHHTKGWDVTIAFHGVSSVDILGIVQP